MRPQGRHWGCKRCAVVTRRASVRTCFPACRASSTSVLCRYGHVPTTTASRLGSLMTSCQFPVACRPGKPQTLCSNEPCKSHCFLFKQHGTPHVLHEGPQLQCLGQEYNANTICKPSEEMLRARVGEEHHNSMLACATPSSLQTLAADSSDLLAILTTSTPGIA